MISRTLLPAALAALTLGPALAAAAADPVSVRVDATANRHPISPLIYGLAFASPAQLADLRCPLNRSGGNATTRYNWKENASNHAADWYFESLPESGSGPGASADAFVRDSRRSGALAMLTVPTLGWIAKLGPDRGKLAAFSIKKYGPQTASDAQWMPDAGNGIAKATGKPVTGNDPRDANTEADPSFQSAWIAHLVATFGKASTGGVRYYLLDNEPSLWHSTHRDVHPTGAPMEEIRDKMLAYAAMIKDADPSALVVGPEEWGWSGYLWSGYDQQYASQHNWSAFPDRAKHGNQDYLPWLLDQIHARETAGGRKLLDVFTVHFYPQGGESGNDVSRAIQLKRNRSTRSLWDPAYTDESWIHAKVALIPRLKGWAAAHDPGVKLGITEYNWGAEGHMNGATAQADALGIFGREGLDMATRWTTPAASTPTYQAIKLFRNYDGRGGAFGDTGVSASTPDPDTLSAFAAVRTTDGALTVMLVHKALDGDAPITLDLAGFTPAGPAQIYQLAGNKPIATLPDVALDGTSLHLTLPAQSVTLAVLPGPPRRAPLGPRRTHHPGGDTLEPRGPY